MPVNKESWFPVAFFGMQALVTLGVSSFAIYMLISHHDDSTNTSIYLPILTGLVGYWLPQPKLKTSKRTTVTLPQEEGQERPSLQIQEEEV